MSFPSTFTSPSSASGSTATVTVEVWMRPLDSVAGTRWTRCTPRSNLSPLHAPRPRRRSPAAVRPTLELQPAPGPAALQQRDDLLEAADPGGMAVHHFPLPALLLRVLGVHAEQLRREEPGLAAACAGPYLEEDVLVVVGTAGNQQGAEILLERALPRGQLVDLGLGQLAHLAVGVLGDDVARFRDAGEHPLVLLELGHRLGQLGGGLGGARVDRGLSDHLRIGERAVQLAAASHAS